jgi:hypothetical protein
MLRPPAPNGPFGASPTDGTEGIVPIKNGGSLRVRAFESFTDHTE